jgi:hypothetical protein
LPTLNFPVARNVDTDQLSFADTMAKINPVNGRTVLKEVKRRIHVRAAMNPH